MKETQKPASPRFANFEAQFLKESRAFMVERARALVWASIVLYPAFWFLDAFLTPELKIRFLVIRLSVLAVFLVVLALVYSHLSERFAEWAVLLGACASVAGISLIAADVGGFHSNYFIGIIIVIIAVGYFMPWSAQRALQACGCFIFIYMAINWSRHGASTAMVAPLFFLVGTAAFTWLATVSSLRSRRRDLSLRLRLEKANEELKNLDAAKTAFFANVSHELRTPMTLMLSPLETLLNRETDDERRTLLRAVLANTHRLLRHVNLLLDAAKLEAGQLQLDLADNDLTALLEDLVTASLPHAGQKGIEIATESLDTIPRFEFDSDKVEMIAANLLSNALKFTPDGGKVIVRAGTEVGSVFFEVEDNGPGIHADQRAMIFDRFHQVDSSLTRQEEGTGLGLTLARELARLHGGDVVVDSEVGRGSLFRVTLPYSASMAADRRVRPRRREDQLVRARADTFAKREYQRRVRSDTLLADIRQPRLSDDALSRKTAPEGAPLVLVVDDNADLRAYLASELSQLYRVETAANGVEGFRKATRLRPQLVIADVMMPIMNGYELCRRLREEPTLNATPIILVTAKAGSEAAIEGLQIGANDYVTKPFSMEELQARIAAQLRARMVERELGERNARLAAIGQITSTVVHDLRNALTLIVGYSDLAHSIAVGGGRREDLVADIEQVRVATQRLRRMTSEILEYARGGGTSMKLSEVAVGEYLHKVLQPMKRHLAGQGIEMLVRDETPPDLKVTLDPDQFGRILENLLGNARDALSETTDKRVYVSAEADESRFVVRVADSGTGISSERLDQLFEPFASGKSKGTGLGLVTVRNLTRAHGGNVEVVAKAQEGGAAFVISIPLHGEPVRPEQEAGEARAAALLPPN